MRKSIYLIGAFLVILVSCSPHRPELINEGPYFYKVNYRINGEYFEYIETERPDHSYSWPKSVVFRYDFSLYGSSFSYLDGYGEQPNHPIRYIHWHSDTTYFAENKLYYFKIEPNHNHVSIDYHNNRYSIVLDGWMYFNKSSLDADYLSFKANFEFSITSNGLDTLSISEGTMYVSKKTIETYQAPDTHSIDIDNSIR